VGNKIEEIGGACSADGEELACSGFWSGYLRERDHLENPVVDGRIILRWIFSKWNVRGMGWIELAQGRDRWRALVNALMNFRVP
jgi:hypothetical protein